MSGSQRSNGERAKYSEPLSASELQSVYATCVTESLLVSSVRGQRTRQHEFTVQLCAFNVTKSGSGIGVASLVAPGTAMVKEISGESWL